MGQEKQQRAKGQRNNKERRVRETTARTPGIHVLLIARFSGSETPHWPPKSGEVNFKNQESFSRNHAHGRGTLPPHNLGVRHALKLFIRHTARHRRDGL
jgi:hypothetical protein